MTERERVGETNAEKKRCRMEIEIRGAEVWGATEWWITKLQKPSKDGREMKGERK